MKKLGFISFLLILINVFILPINVKAQTIEKKDISSIIKPTWIFNAGMSKGKYHDRQDLGFILRENTTLRVRQANPKFKGQLTVRLLGNDTQVEKSIKVGSEWQNIQAADPLVPFVDTPYGSQSAQLEYEVADTKSQKVLPVYEYHGNKSEFFNTWDKYDGNYALIKGANFQLLVPKKDKELVRNLKNYKSIDALIEHYNDLFAYYNQMAGFDNSTDLNKNSDNRYFLKADKHGAGSAYYGNNWTANSDGTVDMWLSKNSWGQLHEIAHGYQAGFDDVGMYTGEVSNNLFGVQYQYNKYGKKADDIGWLFNYGKKDAIEKSLYNKLVKSGGTYASVDLREKLILLSLLKQKAGDDSFTKMYQKYRELANQPDYNKKSYPLPDLMNRIYSENSHQDFTPVLKRWGLAVDDSQGERNRFAEYPAVASLADVVPETELSRAHSLVDPNYLINSNFEMVKNNEIADLKLAGDLTLQLNSESINNLKGVKVTLKDGKKTVETQEIQTDKVTFKSVPNGIYRLEFSGEQMKKYVPDNMYVYVKEAQNNATIKLDEIKSSDLTNQKLDFLGLGNVNFGSFSTNLNQQKADISITNKNPHSYYAGETYLKVIIKGPNGETKYEKNVNGTGAAVGTDNPTLQVGDTVIIFHAETKNRLVSSEPVIDRTNNTNNWTVTEFGLKNQSLKNDPEQDLIKKINKEGNILLEQQVAYPIPLEISARKKQLFQAIQKLQEPHRQVYLTKFSILFT